MTVHSLTVRASRLAEALARRRVVELFEKHRATPGAPYDESHFMDFLLPGRPGRRTVVDGFRASHRFNAFIDDVQYEFAICFSAADRHASHSLQAFLERVVDLDRPRHRSSWPWRRQLTSGLEWALTVLANIVLLIAAVSLSDHAWTPGVLGTAAVLVNAWFVRFAWRSLAYCRHLRLRIMTVENRYARESPERQNAA